MNITVLYSHTQGTSFDALLVDALLSEPGVSRVMLVLGLGSSESDRSRQRLIDRLQFLVARAEQRTIPLDGLGASGAHIIKATEHSKLSDALPEGSVDLFIDFAHTDQSGVRVSLGRTPRLELWSNGHRADLSFSIYPARDDVESAGPKLEVTVGDRQASRRVVEKSDLPSISPYPAIDRRNAMSRSVSLLVRAVRKMRSNRSELEPFAGECQNEARGCVSDLLSLARVTGKAARRFLRRRWTREDRWFLAYRTDRSKFVAQTLSPTPSEFRLLNAERGRFFADPFVISREGRTFVFFEDYRNSLRRGVISCTQVNANGSLGQPFEVLERPFHLSYPFVFEHEGAVFMVPESFANRTVDLYVAKNFPRDWEPRCSLLRDISAVDATLHHDGTTWWMFVSVGEFGAAPWDELSLYYSQRLDGPWRAHPHNPVKRDGSSARPAGPLFYRRGKLIRPAQDCSRVYGGALKLCEIVELTPHSFAERVVDTIPASWLPRAKALHTLSAANGIEAIDARL